MYFALRRLYEDFYENFKAVTKIKLSRYAEGVVVLIKIHLSVVKVRLVMVDN